MQTRLKSTEATTQELIIKTNQLQSENKKLEGQHRIANLFIARYHLKPEEYKELYTKNTPITEYFFIVLSRVQEIHADCRVLMQSGHQTVALDIMEEMNSHHEIALEKLYRWIQNHCRNLDSNDMINPLVIQSMQQLQDRPALFKYVIDEYASARRAILVRNFIDALTSGSKPIEMYAYDPKRYVGDVFAWLHQALPGEKENLLLLIKKCERIDTNELISAAIANITDAVCQPLKMRIQTILNGKDTITLYSIANLIRFYQNIINHVVKGGQLEICMHELRTISEVAYINSITMQVKAQLQNFICNEVHADLSPPISVSKLLTMLKEILSVASMVEERQSDISKIVTSVIDPLLQHVTELASHLTTIDMSVYLMNCLYEIQNALTIFEYMNERVERLQAQCDAQIDALTSEQASSLVANLNLGQIYTVLQSNSRLDIQILKVFLNKFDQFLEMPEMLLLPQVNLLISTAHRNTVQKRAYNVILAIYKQLYDRIMDTVADENYSDNLFNKTPEEVAELLAL